MAQVRLFSYSGIEALKVASDNGQFLQHSAFTFKERYSARQNIEVSTGAAVTSDAALSANAGCRLLRLQVDPGVRVHAELSPSGYEIVPADTSSPILQNNEILGWGAGWRISLLQATEPA